MCVWLSIVGVGQFSSNHWESPRGGGQGKEKFPELTSKTLGGILAEPLGTDRASMGPTLKRGGGSALRAGGVLLRRRSQQAGHPALLWTQEQVL